MNAFIERLCNVVAVIAKDLSSVTWWSFANNWISSMKTLLRWELAEQTWTCSTFTIVWACYLGHPFASSDLQLSMLYLADKIFDDEDSVDGNRPSSASSSTSSKAPANSRRVGMGTTRRLGSAALGSKSSSKLIAYMNWSWCEILIVFMFELKAVILRLAPRIQ